MNVNYKALSVAIENVEFAKDFHYYLTIRIDSSSQKVLKYKYILCASFHFITN